MSRRLSLISLAIMFIALAGGCAVPLLSGKPRVIADFNESALVSGGRGAVMLHAVNRGGLIATRWLKVDAPGVRRSFTVYRTGRHRALDSMKEYDVVTVEPGTYALYSVFSNCEEGLRPQYTDMDEPWQEGVVTPLGMVSRLRNWKPGDVSTSIGAWGSSGGGMGVGVGVSLGGFDENPGQPVSVCNLRSEGLSRGEALLASVTVRPGELVYAGELDIDYGDDGNCADSGNWLSNNETRSYCGASWMTLEIKDAYQSLAKPFIEKNLGPSAIERAVVRLATPGKMIAKAGTD